MLTICGGSLLYLDWNRFMVLSGFPSWKMSKIILTLLNLEFIVVGLAQIEYKHFENNYY